MFDASEPTARRRTSPQLVAAGSSAALSAVTLSLLLVSVSADWLLTSSSGGRT